jgi:hypothetical protein
MARSASTTLASGVSAVDLGLADAGLLRRCARGAGKPSRGHEAGPRLLYRIGRMIADAYDAWEQPYSSTTWRH